MIPATGSCRKTPEIAGTCKQHSDRKSSEKIRKFSGRNITSTRSLELPGTGSFRTVLFDPGSDGSTARRVDKANVVPDYKKLYQYNNAHGIIQKCKEKQVFPVCNTIIREEKFVVINSLF